MPLYNPHVIEPKWQDYWERNKTFRVLEDSARPKLYVLDMFPYPSGEGLHVGHPEGYTATDMWCRYKRMRGFNVLHPMGYDAFGLPAEQYAIETGTHPRVTTERNIANIRRQIKRLGFSYDWDREFATTDPEYVQWTQWIFLVLFDTWFDLEFEWTDPKGRTRRGRGRPIAELPIPGGVRAQGAAALRRYQDSFRLAYQSESPVNWCAALGTVLADEEVINGRSERGDHPVQRVPLRQWMLRITAYADRLVEDLDTLDWPDPIKEMQRNWVGRSEGAEVDFFIGQPSEASGEGAGDAASGADASRAAFAVWKAERARQAFPAPDRGSVGESTPPVPPLPRGGQGGGSTERTHPPATSERIHHPATSGQIHPPATASADSIRVYTTRPDTLFGATYMVLAPEHPLVRLDEPRSIVADAWPEGTPELWKGEPPAATPREAVGRYQERTAAMNEEDRIAGRGEKTGVFTGGYATNPVNGERVPIWIADYVLVSYGTGAIMAVPAHDERDFEFAKKFALPMRAVVMPPEEWLVNASIFRGLKQRTFRAKLDETLKERVGCGSITADAAAARLKRIHEVPDFWESLPELYQRLGSRRLNEGDAVDHPPTTEAISVKGPLIFPYVFEQAFTGDGTSINSGDFNGLPTLEFKKLITTWLSTHGLGRQAVKTKLRDWLFSRQRYWGEPFPILHEVDGQGNPTGLTRAVAAEDLPVRLPELEDFKPTGRPEPPLEKATAWVWLSGAKGERLRRETNTMPQWAGSCWYYLRFCDPRNNERAWAADKERYWMPVDLYVGGAEHAVLHLLYSRFWHKVLFDRGHVSTMEPFQRLVNQGMILSITYRTQDGRIVPYTKIKFGEGAPVHAETGQALAGETEKMSKSRGNVIPVDVPLGQYGADTTRLYEMFMGPLEQTKPWSMEGVEGISRLLKRSWRMIIDEQAEGMQLNSAVTKDTAGDEQLRMLHKTIRAVTEDVEGLRFNTAIARLFEFVNFFTGQATRPRACMEPFVLMLAPLAPHIAEELWQALGHSESLVYAPWPAFDERYTREDSIEIPVQVNGKVRSRVVVPVGADKAEIERVALADPRIQSLLDGKPPKKVIVVPGKLVNIVSG